MTNETIFRILHQDRNAPLILPNVWDAGGARLVESLGARAVATTSAGVAWAKGYQDGNVMPARTLALLAAEIVRAVKVPVSIDVEAGYSDNPSTVAENLKAIAATGISGINIEDGLDDPSILAKKIEAIRKMAASEGLDLFINARTDVYLQDLASDDGKPAETIRRSKIYQDAGADGLFVPGMTRAGDISRVTDESTLPVNLMSSPSLPKLPELKKLNVRRLSAGTAIAQILYEHMARLAEGFLAEGDCEIFNETAMGYSDLQGLF